MVKTSLYNLRKEGLRKVCGALDLEAKGAVEDMRKAVTALLTTPDLAVEMEDERFRDYALRPQDMMRHLSYITRQQLERICRNSRREYQIIFGNTLCQHLKEMISLGERFEDVPAPTVSSPPRETSGPSRERSDHDEYQQKRASETIISMIGNTLVPSFTVGALTTRGVVDTGATSSIIQTDMIGFIPHIIATEVSANTIQMADGSLRDNKQMITVQPTNSKLARQATNDNAERADIENMVRFDQPEPVKPKREFRIRHSNIIEVSCHQLELLTTGHTKWQHRWTTQETISSYQNYEQRSPKPDQFQINTVNPKLIPHRLERRRP
uniref:Uncharacterized protein n=1 Tax=Glossina pallidipes TaxID=7398 RepID=A0A1B0A3S9_GLOPL